MNRVSASIIASAALLGLAACSDSVTEVAAPADLKPSMTQYSEFNDSHGHVMKVKDEGKKDADDAQKDAKNEAKVHPGQGTGIYFHGGPVLQSGTKVVAIYWAPSANQPIYANAPSSGTGGGNGDNSLVGFFLSNLGGSPYFNINSTYTNGTTAIQNSVTYSGYWVNTSSAPSGTQRVTDTQMIAMLQSGFDSGALTYDDHTLYAIFTTGKVNLGGGFGTQYCAYHTHGTVTINGASKTALYAAMPYDYAYPGSCTNGTAPANGSVDPGADGEVNTLAHEIEETTTDMMGNAWFDNKGYENADKCAWTWGSTYTSAAGGLANMKIGGKDFLVQQNWVNSGNGGCRTSW